MEKKVTFDETGVLLESGPENCTVAWADIDRIFVFKKDLFAVDLICLAIDAGDNRFDLDEDFGGWLEFAEGISEYLPECAKFEEWFEAVAFPPFETNPTRIYERPS